MTWSKQMRASLEQLCPCRFSSKSADEIETPAAPWFVALTDQERIDWYWAKALQARARVDVARYAATANRIEQRGRQRARSSHPEEAYV